MKKGGGGSAYKDITYVQLILYRSIQNQDDGGIYEGILAVTNSEHGNEIRVF